MQFIFHVSKASCCFGAEQAVGRVIVPDLEIWILVCYLVFTVYILIAPLK